MMMNENNRLHYWAALTIFSLVSLSSMTNFFAEVDVWEREQKWVVSVASISLIFGIISFFLRMFMTKMFTESKMEHLVVFVVLVFWCVGLPYINDRENFFAVNMDGVIYNINLFFSSWMAFIMSMILFVDMFPSLFLKDNTSKFMKHWIGFGTASLVAMTNAVMFWRDNCDSTDTSDMCHRDLFAFVLGAISGLFALTFVVINHERLEQVTSVVLLAAWCFGIAYLTFDQGPAKYVGSFYFSVWFTFMFALWMAVHSIVDIFTGMFPEEETPATDEGKGTPEETAKQDAEEHEQEEVA